MSRLLLLAQALMFVAWGMCLGVWLGQRHAEEQATVASPTGGGACFPPMERHEFVNPEDRPTLLHAYKGRALVFEAPLPASGGLSTCVMPDWTFVLEGKVSQ